MDVAAEMAFGTAATHGVRSEGGGGGREGGGRVHPRVCLATRRQLRESRRASPVRGRAGRKGVYGDVRGCEGMAEGAREQLGLGPGLGAGAGGQGAGGWGRGGGGTGALGRGLRLGSGLSRHEGWEWGRCECQGEGVSARCAADI